MIVFSLSFCGSMVFLAYSSGLTSILLVHEYNPPFTSLRELSKATSSKLYITSGASTQNEIIAKAQDDTIIKEVYEKNIRPFEVTTANRASIFKQFAESGDELSAFLLSEITFLATCEKSKGFVKSTCIFLRLKN